jgi:hypothetical protein
MKYFAADVPAAWEMVDLLVFLHQFLVFIRDEPPETVPVIS